MKIQIRSILFAFLFLCQLASCQVKIANLDDILICKNGTSPMDITQDFRFPGSLLFYDTTQSIVVSYDGKTHTYTPLMDLTGFENEYVSSISPDGQWLLVSQHKQSDPSTIELRLVSYTGQIQTKTLTIPESDDKVLRYSKWLNEQSFLGWVLRNGYNSYGIFEPLVPQWHPLEFRNLTFYVGTNSGILLSPDLSRILYINKESSLVLYDLLDNRILWENPDYDAIDPVISSPVLQPSTWSEDGNMLAIPSSKIMDDSEEYGIIVFDKTGDIIRLAQFENRAFGLNFSHSNKFLSFFEERPIQPITIGERVPVIRMIEIATGKVQDLCILSSNTDPIYNVITKTVLWSPDDAYIAYNYGKVPPSQNLENRNGIIIQKLDEEEIWLIPSGERNYILLGWSPYQWKKPD